MADFQDKVLTLDAHIVVAKLKSDLPTLLRLIKTENSGVHSELTKSSRHSGMPGLTIWS